MRSKRVLFCGFMILLTIIACGFKSFADEVRFGPASAIQEQKNTWMYDSVGWWLRHPDGSYPVNQWHQDVDGSWYYFNEQGYMLMNTKTPDGYWVGKDGKWDGVAAENWQWRQVGSDWYYTDLNSGKNWTGWLQDGGYWYYLEADGKMKTGLTTYKANVYYLNDGKLNIPFGAMISNGVVYFSLDELNSGRRDLPEDVKRLECILCHFASDGSLDNAEVDYDKMMRYLEQELDI